MQNVIHVQNLDHSIPAGSRPSPHLTVREPFPASEHGGFPPNRDRPNQQSYPCPLRGWQQSRGQDQCSQTVTAQAAKTSPKTMQNGVLYRVDG